MNGNLCQCKRRVWSRSGLLLYIVRSIVRYPAMTGLLTFTGLFTFVAPAQSRFSVSFHDSCVVNDTVIRVGDIAHVEGTAPESLIDEIKRMPVGESAPPGYSRFVNSTDALSYAHGMAVKTLLIDNSKCKRILVKTDYQEKSVGDFEDAVRDYLYDKIGWQGGTYSISILNKNEKWKCLPQPFTIKIDGLSSKYPKGNVNIKLFVKQGSKLYCITISCFIKVVVPVVVSKLNIPRGTMLTHENCLIEEKDITHYNYVCYNTLNEIKNAKSSREILAGTIICSKAVINIPLIERDDQVQVMVTHGRVRICMSARARESGSVGEKIWVENEMTHKLLKTRVLSHGKVVLIDGEGTI